jgi:hypothetical protein
MVYIDFYVSMHGFYSRFISSTCAHCIIIYYNIAFVNSERWLAKSRVDVTQCQHGNVGKMSFFIFLCAIL